MKTPPENVSEAVKKRNPHLYGSDFAEPSPAALPPKRIRQDSKPLLNKLETEFCEHLKRTFWQPLCNIHCQAIRFKLGNGIWYKPDFTVTSDHEHLVCYEVKGPHAFRGGFENLKVAASKYPDVLWFLVWKQDGEWKEQEVLP